MRLARPALLAAFFLLNASCGHAGADGKIECQKRLIAYSAGSLPSGAGRLSGLARAFEERSSSFARMPLEGCSDDQREEAAIFVTVTRNLSRLAARVGDLREALEQSRRPQSQELLVELASAVEQYERRRQVLRQDLNRMLRERQGR